jgi:PAS domain-containing protein
MKLRRDLLLGVGALVGFNLLVALSTVGLLSRMSPAIETILQDNVASIQAAEEMMRLLALAGAAPLGDVQAEQFAAALQRAQNNITEPNERAVVMRVRARHEAALAGDPDARQVVLVALGELVALNRDAMIAADHEAQRMGTAGAWSAVFIAVLGFLVSLSVIRRLRRSIVEPLAELYATLEAARKGDRFRRCTGLGTPPEIRRIFHVVNEMLDEQERKRGRASSISARRALEHLLEQQRQPAFVVDGRGHLIAANRRGLERLESPGGEALRQELARVPLDPDGAHGDLASVQLGDGESWYCELAHGREGAGEAGEGSS